MHYTLPTNGLNLDANTIATIKNTLPGPGPELKRIFDNAIIYHHDKTPMQQFLQQLSTALSECPHTVTKYKFLINGKDALKKATKIAHMSKDYLPLTLNGMDIRNNGVTLVFSRITPIATNTLLTQARDRPKPVVTESQSGCVPTTETASLGMKQ